MLTYCVKCRKNTENLHFDFENFSKKKMVDKLSNQNVLTVELKSQDL